MSGDRRDEAGDGFGFLALVELGRHLAKTAGAAFGDGAKDEGLAPRGGRDVLATRTSRSGPMRPTALTALSV